jgi:serine/threonine protein kinase
MNHENIIGIYEVFNNDTYLFIVMEYASQGDLLHYVRSKKKLSEEEALKYFRQLIYGVAHIHCRGVLHRDIKLDNILLDDDMGVKICDFGVSRQLCKGQIIKEQCGTPAYLAPEIIINCGYSGFFSDLWSIGIALFTMLCGAVPYRGNSLQELLNAEKNEKIVFPSHLSPLSKDLIERLLEFEPYKRITIPEIMQHPWFTRNKAYPADEDLIEINDEESEKPDVNVLQLGNLFLKRMPLFISKEDYNFIANKSPIIVGMYMT